MKQQVMLMMMFERFILIFLRKLHRDVLRVLRHLPWFLAGFEVQSQMLLILASTVPVRIESM